MLKTMYICLIFILVLRVSIQAQDLDLMKLNYAELDSLVSIEYDKGTYENAIPYIQAGKRKAEIEFGMLDTTYAKYVENLGFFLYQAGQYQKAEKFWLESVDLNTKILGKDHEEYVESINNLAVLYQDMGNYAQAEKLLVEGKNILIKTLGKENPQYARSLNNLATLYHDLGKYTLAKSLYKEAERICVNVLDKEHSIYITSLSNLAGLYHDTGDYERAEGLYLKVKKIKAETIGTEHPSYALSLHNLATLCKDLGKYTQAKLLFLEAKRINIKMLGVEHPLYLLNVNGLSSLLIEVDSFKQAIPFLIEVKEIASKVLGKEHITYVNTLDALANLYLNIGNLKEAEVLFLEAKNVKNNIFGENHFTYALSLQNLAFTCLEMGNYKKAESLFLKAKNMKAKTFDNEKYSYAIVLYGLARLYYELNDLNRAFRYSLEAIAANSTQINNDFEELNELDKFEYYSNEHLNYTLEGLLQIIKAQYKKTGDKAKLKQHYQLAQVAIRLNEKFRNDFRDDDDKLRTLEMNNDFVKTGISTALLLDQPTHIQEAFSFAEQNKSILLADAIKGNRARVFGDLPDTLAEEELQLQKKLAELKKENYSVQTADEKANVSRELGELNLKIDSFLKSLKDKYPKYHALKYENITAKAQEIQSLLDEKSLMIEYFQTDTILYLFALSKDQVALYPISIHKDSLEKRIGTLRNALSNFIFNIEKKAVSDEHYVENAHWLYQKIVAIALKDKSIKNLIVITDGALGHLPFEAFLTRAVKGEKDYRLMPYLLNDYTISYNYSATLWKDNLKEGKTNSNGEILAFGATYPKVDSNALSFRLPYFLDLRLSLPQLPESEHEVNVLAQNFEGNFLIGEQANEQLFKEKALGYGIIHLAMHGRSNSRIPMLSSLAFTEDNNQEENNFLEAYEISQLELNANLVVLSACETGYGKFKQGEGVISIARSFMYAGAPSLIVSLWQVNDASTAVLMQSFYYYLAAGKTKDVALRQAKLDYIQSAKGDKAHPIFWSAFIQLGNTAPIALETKRSIWRNVLIGFLFLVLFAAGIKYWTKKR